MLFSVLAIFILKFFQTSSTLKIDRGELQNVSALFEIPFLFSENKKFHLFSFLKNLYLPVTNVQNKQCKKVVDRFLTDLTQGTDSWAVRMFDSWGKIPPDGYLIGNYHILGMFEECLDIRGNVETIEDGDISFKGRYCRIHIQKIPTQTSNNGSNFNVLTYLQIQYATCMPSVCTDDDLHISLNETFDRVGFRISRLECQEAGESYHETAFDGFDAFVCSLILLLVLLAICGTIIQENNLHFCRTSFGKIIFEKLEMFSVAESFRNIFAFEKRNQKTISCTHGIRSLTLLWIMICHQAVNMAPVCNDLIFALKLQVPRYAQLLMNSYIAADTFLFLSGLFVSYHLFPVFIETKGSVASFFKKFLFKLIRRLMRMSPVILMVAMFCATLLRFTGYGPWAQTLDAFSEKCRDYWWKDPLFLNNLIHEEGSYFFQKDCLVQCWYTSIEMQLFLIIPFVFIPFIYYETVGYIWLSLLTLLAQAIPMLIIIINNYPPAFFIYEAGLNREDEMYKKFYEVPWCRSGPWFVGLWIGILLYRNPKWLNKINKIHVYIAYILGSILATVILLGLYPYNYITLNHGKVMDTWLAALYGFFSASLWALCIAVVIVTCHIKKAYYVNAFLSYWGWQPISRLSFAIYLIGPIVQKWWATTLFIPIHCASYYEIIFNVAGTFFISFIISFILWCLVEGPLLKWTKGFSSSKAIMTK